MRDLVNSEYKKIKVELPRNARAIASGRSHNCALLEDGGVSFGRGGTFGVLVMLKPPTALPLFQFFRQMEPQWRAWKWLRRVLIFPVRVTEWTSSIAGRNLCDIEKTTFSDGFSIFFTCKDKAVFSFSKMSLAVMRPPNLGCVPELQPGRRLSISEI